MSSVTSVSRSGIPGITCFALLCLTLLDNRALNRLALHKRVLFGAFAVFRVIVQTQEGHDGLAVSSCYLRCIYFCLRGKRSGKFTLERIRGRPFGPGCTLRHGGPVAPWRRETRNQLG